MRDTMQADGKIGPTDLDLLCLTDDVDKAVAHIVESDATLAAEQERAEQAAAARLARDVREAAAEAAEAV
jgi:hypothetical protein